MRSTGFLTHLGYTLFRTNTSKGQFASDRNRKFRISCLAKYKSSHNGLSHVDRLSNENNVPFETKTKYRFPTATDLRVDGSFVYNKDNIELSEEDQYVYRNIKHLYPDLIEPQRFITGNGIYRLIDSLRTVMNQKSKYQELDYIMKIEDLYRNMISTIVQMKPTELITALRFLTGHDEDEIMVIKRAIDIELCRKLECDHSWDNLDIWLKAGLLTFESKLRSKLIESLMKKLGKQSSPNSSRRQVLSILFLCIRFRSLSPTKLGLEKHLIQMVDNASIHELALISLSHFKTMTQLPPSLLSKVVNRLIEILPRIDPKEPGYCAIIKSLRYSFKSQPQTGRDLLRLIKKLCETSNEHVVNQSLFNLMQTAKIMEACRWRDNNMLDKLYHSITRSPDDSRFKDIQYGLTTLSNCLYNDLQLTDEMRQKFDYLSDTIVKQSRYDAILQLPYLMPLLRSFITYGYYNHNLMDFVSCLMNDQLALKQMKSFEFGTNLLLVHVSAFLETGEAVFKKNLPLMQSIVKIGDQSLYSGFVDDKEPSTYILNNIELNEDWSQTHRVFRRLAKIGTRLYSDRDISDPGYKISFQHLMPFNNYSDLILSKGGNIPETFDPESLTPIASPLDEKRCLLLVCRNHDYLAPGRTLSGYRQLIIRLYTKLGYSVVPVNTDNYDSHQLVRDIKNHLES